MDERRLREALRYMNAQPGDSEAERMAQDAWAMLSRDTTPRMVTHLAQVTWDADGFPILEGTPLPGTYIRRILKGCDQAWLLAATLGAQTDLTIRRLSALSIARGLAYSATASAYLEAYLDAECDKLAGEALERARYAKPRVSPGYGDFTLDVERALLDLADGRRIGLALTSGGMLAPEKSVVALIGLGDEPSDAPQPGCAGCDAAFCIYREEST